MHLAILPGLILALATSLSANAINQQIDGPAYNNQFTFFSVAAQATTTATLTTGPTATGALTTTGSITGTATLTGTTPTVAVTPISVPTEAPQPTLQGNPFDFQFLTSAPSPALGPFAWAYLVVMALLFAGSGYFYFYKRPQWRRTNSVYYRAAGRWGQTGLWISGLGILFWLFRAIGIDLLNLRFWLYLWALAALVAAVWFIYWYNSGFKKELARFQKAQRNRQYMPKSRGGKGRGASPVVSNPPTTPAEKSAGSAGKARQSTNAQKRRKRR